MFALFLRSWKTGADLKNPVDNSLFLLISQLKMWITYVDMCISAVDKYLFEIAVAIDSHSLEGIFWELSTK